MDGTTGLETLYAGEEARWAAVRSRDGRAEGRFFYGVTTTGVFCRPSCPSRVPRRENVTFFDNAEAAERAGFRPCRRCRPTGRSVGERQLAAVKHACALIDEAETPPSLGELAEATGLSPFHLHRVFKDIVGITPKDYAAERRSQKLKGELLGGTPVAEAIYGAGYGSSSRLYENARATLGMTPAAYRKGAQGRTIRWSTAATPLGRLVVAATDEGVAMIEFGEDEDELAARVARRFPNAAAVRADQALAGFLDAVARFIELPSRGLELPLDIRGTAFQRRVWQALRQIPPGTTASYSEVAERLGHPRAARAVANACAANPVALAVPCHRVVGADGGLAGYRWGVDLKRALLQREGGDK